jgi:hypothetical protein
MFNLESIGLETAFNVVRILGFLLICVLGGVAWLVYFLAQEQKKPVDYPAMDFGIGNHLRRPNNFYSVDGLNNLMFQAEIRARWANPDYEVVGKARRVPFPQVIIDNHHKEALAMIERKENLSVACNITYYKKLRVPFSEEAIENNHIQALKMIRSGKYD